MSRPLVFLTLAYVAGITLGRFFMPCIFIVPAAAAFLWVLWLIFHEKSGVQAFIPFLLLFLVAGGIRYHYALVGVKGNVRGFDREECILVGMVADEPLWREDDVVFPLRAQQVSCGGEEYPVSGTVQVTVQFAPAGGSAKGRAETAGAMERLLSTVPLGYGQKISLQGILYEPKGRRNPGGFDHRAFLEARGIAAGFYASAENVAPLGLSPELSVLRRSALLLKNRMAGALKAFLPDREGNLLVGMLFGERCALDPEVENIFSKSGIAHLLAVSGLHVGLAAGAIFLLGRRLRLQGGGAFLFAALLLFAYVYLCGLKPSAIRALIMVLLSMGAVHLGRTRDFPTTLAAAVLLTLLYNPFLLFSVSFQLSYAAATAILCLSPLLQNKIAAVLARLPLSLAPAHLKGFSALAAVTLAAQCGVLPLTAYYFRQISLVALPANIFVLPVMPAVMGLGLVCAVLGVLWPLAGSLLTLANYPLLAYILFMAKMFSALPFAYHAVYPPHLIEITFYYVFLALPAGGWQAVTRFYGRFTRRCRPFYLLVFLLGIALVATWWGWLGAGLFPLEVIFLDVGQGDAIFIHTPQGQNILLDSGGKPLYRGNIEETGHLVVLPFLEYRRVKKLDMVIISHPHEDHYGGLIAVLEKIPVKQLVTTAAPSETQFYNDLLERARGKNIPREIACAGDVFTAGPFLEFRVLGPPAELFSGIGSDANNNSLVLHLCYKDVGFLFTGDIEAKAIEHLLAEETVLPAQVIKIPHHGGRLANLPQLLEKTAPHVAVISVGANSFGHPHVDTLAALEDSGAEIYRTDLHGAVTLRCNGQVSEVKTMCKESIFAGAAGLSRMRQLVLRPF